MSIDDDKLSGLYHAAKQPGPSKTLDDAILAAARDAVSKPASAKGPFTSGWPAVASVAAVIVIAVMVVPLLKQQDQQLPPETFNEQGRLADDTGLKAERTDLMKTKPVKPSPASEPLLFMKEELHTQDRAMPAASRISSDATEAPVADMAIPPEEDKQYESGASSTTRTRKQAADSAPFAIYTPEMWEEKIVQLISADRPEEAKAELEALKRYYPDYKIKQPLINELD